jgi:hypothetical protein
MKKEFNFRLIDTSTKLRYTATVEVELRNNRSGLPVFSVMANIGNGSRWIQSGQCLDTIMNDYRFKNPANKIVFDEIYNLWKKYHLNDMNAGTPKQTAAIKEGFDAWRKELGYDADFTNKCRYLQSINLYLDYEYTVNGVLQSEAKTPEPVGYRYGSGWIYFSISEDDLNHITTLLS